MIKRNKIVLVSSFALAIFGIYFYLNFLTLSADLNNYKAYLINDNSTTIPSGSVKVTFFGTTTLLIDDGETQLLTDGFFTRPSFSDVFFGELKTDTTLVKTILLKYKTERLKGIFTGHSHFDHAMDAAYIAKVSNATLYGSTSTVNIGRGEGLSENQLQLFEPGKEINIGKFSVSVFKTKHAVLPKLINDVGEEITQPLKQPAKMKDYKEGGSYDFVIKHEGHSILIKSSCNFTENDFNNVKADVLFLSVAGFYEQSTNFKENLYKQTIEKTKPSLVIPMHWDDFFKPLSENLEPEPKGVTNVAGAFNYLIERTKYDGINFGILQGKKSVLLFTDEK